MPKKIYTVVQELPTEVKIGALLFDVTRSKLRGTCGECHYEEEEIRIDPTLSDNIAKVTFIHEILHAILFNAGYISSAEQHDENQIDCLAHGLLSLFRDNPEIISVIK